MRWSVEDNNVPGNVRNRHLDADELFNAMSPEEKNFFRCYATMEWKPAMHALAFELIPTTELSNTGIRTSPSSETRYVAQCRTTAIGTTVIGNAASCSWFGHRAPPGLGWMGCEERSTAATSPRLAIATTYVIFRSSSATDTPGLHSGASMAPHVESQTRSSKHRTFVDSSL
ncbi:hypothetical protein MRX96_019010 [Rhipicephalus microplus]